MRMSDWSSDVCSSDLLEQRLEFRQHQRAIELHGLLGEHVAAAVADGHVAGAVGREREADADQLGLGRVPAGGLGVDRDEALVPRLGDPAVERRRVDHRFVGRSEEHTSELQSLMRISYAVFCLKNKNNKTLRAQIHNSKPTTKD